MYRESFPEVRSRKRTGSDKIAHHQSDEGYSVSAPGLPGCWSQGKTEAEALANIEAAIREYLGVAEDLLEDAEARR